MLFDSEIFLKMELEVSKKIKYLVLNLPYYVGFKKN
jgi:hypothetical protein